MEEIKSTVDEAIEYSSFAKSDKWLINKDHY